MADEIKCSGIKTHNLKNLSISLPHKKWIAVTGVSGSGKSSLVFDTIYAESQRRFLETLGTYERQFLQGLPQGNFETLENLPAAIALKQTHRNSDPRSVIASAIDIAEPFRLLFSSLMEPSCKNCGSPTEMNTPTELLEIIRSEKNTNYLISVPIDLPDQKKTRKKLCEDLVLEGYTRLLVNDKIINLEDSTDINEYKTTEIALDRVNAELPEEELVNRIETLWTQIRFSSRFSLINVRKFQTIDSVGKDTNALFVQPYCSHCQQKTTVIQSTDLDWQSALGACKECHGLGNVPTLDEQKIIPDPRLSLEKNAIKPFSSQTFLWMHSELIRECEKQGIPTNIPYTNLSQEQKRFIWEGKTLGKKGNKHFVNLREFFQVLEEERYKSTSRILLAKYRKYVSCPQCEGARLSPQGRRATCGEKTFYQLCQGEITDVENWLEFLLTQKKYEIKIKTINETYKEVVRKINLLTRLGLGSSSLYRRCKTLSGGEYQRVLLTRVIGNGLTDALYVLDEPSVGLGKNEIPELINCLQELRDLGNTVLVVEHDTSVIAAADVVIELGPGGGTNGGNIISIGNEVPLSAQVQLPDNLQVPNRKVIGLSSHFSKEKSIWLENFSAMHCHNINLEIPLGMLTVVAGCSGAGKSTLVTYGLQAALEKFEALGITYNENGDDDNKVGIWTLLHTPEHFFSDHNLVIVEQRAMHRSITSVPATLLGLMDPLRKEFAALEKSKQKKLEPSDFSFNGAGGCENCRGQGIVEDDLFFLGQVEKICPECQGTRYMPYVLEVTWKGKTIYEWLSSPMQYCLEHLGREKGFGKPLHLACQLGLGHIPLGLPTSSLSGGEAQRLRICAALSKSSQKIICLLDEPTRGLSEKDVSQLLLCLLRLKRDGHTFVVIEHHHLFEKFADQLLKMGPESGAHGGQIVEREVCVS